MADCDDWLPEKPEEPLQSDCCGTGCTPCVFDIYQGELERWMKLKKMTPEDRKIHVQTVASSNSLLSPHQAVSPARYTAFEISDIRPDTFNTNIYRFSLPKGTTLGLLSGQHVVARIYNDNSEAITRQYTPISALHQSDWFEVIIKVYKDGRMSKEMEKWRIGTSVEWKGPFGSFVHDPSKYKHLLMLACGTGVAPMVQVIRSILENEEDETIMHLMYACRSQHEILMKTLLDEFKMFWNFHVTYSLSQVTAETIQRDPGLIKYGDKVWYGRLNDDIIMNQTSFDASHKTFVLICGTKSFDKDMIKIINRSKLKNCYFKF